MTESAKSSSDELKRDLNLLDATMINVGTIIGSGIFLTPGGIAAYLDSTLMYLAVWVIGGVISLFGALSVAELGASMPRTGGLFIYLKEAYGPVFGYLYGWSSLSVINSASIAAIAVAFATYLGGFVELSAWGVKAAAIGSIVVLTVMNILGVKFGAWIQNGFGFAKVGAMLFLIAACFTMAGGEMGGFKPLWPESSAGLASAFGLAMIAVLWSYDGWIEVTYTAGEVKDPQRNLPRAILFSILIILVVYLLINIAYVYVLSLDGVTQSQRVAADTAAKVITGGAAFMGLAVMFSTFGANNGFILGASRIYYAMAHEGLFFRRFGKTHPTRKTPVFSLLIQMIWSSALVLLGSFNQLITYMVFASWLFYLLCVGAVFIMRRRHPNMERPYKTWGYPVTPIIFILFALWLVINAIVEDPGSAGVGLLLIVSGLPLYFFKRKQWQATA